MPFDSCGFVDPVVEVDDEIISWLEMGRARIAQPGGWIQRKYDKDDSYCALGAIEYYIDDSDPSVRIRSAIYLHRALPWRWSHLPLSREMDWAFIIILFNDTPWRRKRAVLALYDRAIEIRRREFGCMIERRRLLLVAA